MRDLHLQVPMLTRTPNRRHSRPGTALAETLLALPFLFLITLFIVYFGRSYVWMQRTHIADRYQAWREAGHTPGPGPDEPRGHPQINDAFFGETADAIGHGGHHGFPDDAPARWGDEAAKLSDDAGDLARAMRDNMSSGRTSGFSITHNSSNKILQQFDGPIRANHTVQDHDWKHVNGFPFRGGPWDQIGPHATNVDSIRDIFYKDFDDTLRDMGDNPFANMMRSLYLDLPGYRGPVVWP